MIEEGNTVIIIDNSANRRIVTLESSKYSICFSDEFRTIKHFKAFIDPKMIIGQQFGTFFSIKDVKKGDLEVIDDPKIFTYLFLEDPSQPETNGEEHRLEETKEPDGQMKDNRDIVDNNQAQKLSPEEIERLKQEGIQGKEIIDQLIKGSESFSKRTKFSQEKYIKKKKQKYEISFEVRKPSALELCEAYQLTYPDKICGLRVDSFALLMNYANINSQSNAVVIENTRGLVTGALVERQAQKIVRVEMGSDQIKMRNDSFLQYNFFSYDNKSVQYVHQDLLIESRCSDLFTSQLLKASLINKFNAFIMVHDQYHPKEGYLLVEKLLQPNAYISIFCQFLHPLSELQEYLMKEKKAIFFRLEELWTREYQVLPLRTHPKMSMHGASGFILSAIKVY